MRQNKFVILSAIAFASLSVACSGAKPSEGDSDSDSLGTTRRSAVIAQIIETVGKVEFKRENGKAWQTAKVGTDLYHGDLVRPAGDGSKGEFRCTTNSRIVTFDRIMGVANVCTPPR